MASGASRSHRNPLRDERDKRLPRIAGPCSMVIFGVTGDLSRRKLDIEREKLQAGRSSNFQVLSFESDLRNAESARLNALIAYLNTQAHLDQTLGTTLESWDIDLND